MRIVVKKRICLLGCWLLAILVGYAQSPDLKFSYVTKPEALASQEIMSLMKDKEGSLWVGTINGLNRFDGHNNFRFSKSAGGLANSSILSLCSDQSGKIWGGTATGIFRFDPKSQQFRNYSMVNKGDGPAIENIICTSNGEVFAGGIPGILKYDASRDSFVNIAAGTSPAYSITADRLRKNSMVEDPSGKGMWVATTEGLNYYEFQTGRFLNYKNQPNGPVFNNHFVRALAISPQGHVWVADNQTLQLIAFKHGMDKPLFVLPLTGWLKNNVAATVFEDSHQHIWLAMLDGRMVKISGWQQSNPVIKEVRHSRDDPNSIINSFFWDALEDEDGTVWLGTLSGLAKINTSRDFYKMHLLSEKVPALQQEFAVAWLTENKADSSIWIALLHDKVIRYHPATGAIKTYELNKAVRNQRGELPGRINHVAFFDQFPVVNCFNGSWILKPNGIVPFLNVPAPYTHLSFSEMAKAADGSYWLSDKKVLVHWIPASNKAEAFKLKPEQGLPATGLDIHRLRFNGQGILWMALNNRYMAYFHHQSGTIRPVPFRLPEDVLKTSYYYNYDIDESGNIWLPFSGFGLVKIGADGQQQTWWSDSSGMRNSIEATIAGMQGQVWCFSKNKITVMLSKTNSMYQYELPYGNHNFNYTVFTHRLQSGNLLANIGGDLLELMPERIIGPPNGPRAMITAVQIGEKERQLFGDSLLRLQPEENFLTFRFGSLTDQQLFPYQLQYKLENLDANWKDASQSGTAVYTQLAPGDYVFKVALVGKNGEWRSAEQKLYIHLSTPFYKSNWFRLLVILLVGGILYYWYAERMTQQKKLFATESKSQLLAKEKTQVQYENLKQHLNPHFLFNSLTTLSSLIEINPKMAGSFLRSLSKTYRYILQSKDKETVALADELAFVQTFITLQQTRFEQGLQVVNNVPAEYLNRHIVPVTLQNLVENAIKHNIIDDENVLRITMEVENDYLVVANKMQLKKFVETSNKQGLDNLQSLYTYLTDKPLTYGVNEDYFIVKIPLL